MSEWGYEVEAAVHPVVHNVSSVQPTLVTKVALKLIVDVLDDRPKAGIGKKQSKINTSSPILCFLT